ncbi:hypothetical protein BU26DRAFT_65296 [Trematosphaeria pertusa]|uniref:Uncharacterized protein n=1 Tax=Trematosphaeria pertusa TaxID=390896 RepID=A0A6A6I860_9PLEO|nr:uncharacterized protein BU26DRAFT_65296 [Trematosphaeria pertusa]KAF2246268.1 hypothetical protein BU26DRAFT_65296 [Trematosphaeria pertusa]
MSASPTPLIGGFPTSEALLQHDIYYNILLRIFGSLKETVRDASNLDVSSDVKHLRDRVKAIREDFGKQYHSYLQTAAGMDNAISHIDGVYPVITLAKQMKATLEGVEGMLEYRLALHLVCKRNNDLHSNIDPLFAEYCEKFAPPKGLTLSKDERAAVLKQMLRDLAQIEEKHKAAMENTYIVWILGNDENNCRALAEDKSLGVWKTRLIDDLRSTEDVYFRVWREQMRKALGLSDPGERV